MTKEKLLQELKYTQKKHQNDHVDTFGTNISLMCADIVNVLNRCVEMSEGLTNGEVFTSTYPNIEVLGDSESKVGVNLGNGVFINFPRTWWNQKWGE